MANFIEKDGPAVIFENYKKEWYTNGILHRENGPAITYKNGHEEWWVNGKLHRKDGPAIVLRGNYEECWANNKRHREDGRVFIHDEYREYWKEGKFIEKGDIIVLTILEILSKGAEYIDITFKVD